MSRPDDLDMIAATWKTVEALGVPDSPTRRILFDLARVMQSTSEPNEIAMAGSAFSALNETMREIFTPKSPLQQQLDYRKAQRDLHALTGVMLDDVRGDRFELELLPETPRELAQRLGYEDGGRKVRQILREGFPDHAKHERWEPLTEKQVNYVKAHLPPH